MSDKKIDPKKIDEIVTMLDQFASGSAGHMNITVADGKIEAETIVQQTNGVDCAPGDSACKVPNLFEGLDTDSQTE